MGLLLSRRLIQLPPVGIGTDLAARNVGRLVHVPPLPLQIPIIGANPVVPQLADRRSRIATSTGQTTIASCLSLK